VSCGLAVSLLALALAAPVRAAAAGDAAQTNGYDPALFAGLRYRMVGPSRGGRVTAVAGHRARRSTFFMGASGGGVWKTTDYGHSWHNVSDGYFATGSIGAIRVADSDPDVVWVGTGSDGLRSNVIIGKGVYRSDDGGTTWRHVGLEAVGNIGALLVHPEDPDRVWVAAIGNPFAPNPERGVFRTADGGETWERVLFVSERTGAVDLEFAPDDPTLIYATLWRAERKPWTIISGGREGGVYRSRDGGETWAPLTGGLPEGLRGKADLAVSGADPDRVYVLIEAPGDKGGVYRSDDRGDTWRQVTDFQPIRNRPFYYTNLEAHPKDPDVLWGMAEGHWKSEDGGVTWKRQSVPHGDNHDMWINPDDPEILIQSNDGGANVSLDGGKSWSTQHNQPTAELYQVDVSDEVPYRLYAGQQDNSTISVPSRPPRLMPGGSEALWEAVGGCETGPAVPKPGDPDVVYANCKGRFGVYDRRTGQEQQFYVGFWNLYGHNPKELAYRFQRVAPIHVSPHDPDRVYHGSQFVHVTRDGGRTWRVISPDLTAFTEETQVVSGTPITIDVTGEEHFSALYDIQESPVERGVIWVGANDGPIHVTRDDGETWVEVTPEDLGPYGRVQQLEASPHEAGKAYACVLRYQLGDFQPHAYRTNDYGASWTRITTGSNGIPADHPVRVVREDPFRPGLLYAGTEFGMFVSFDDGGHWQSFQQNLPVTPVTDIKLVGEDLVLSTMGRGFWILYGLSPLRELTAETAGSDHLFAVRPVTRLRQVGRGGRRPGLPHEPEYPPVGVVLDYYLASEPDVELSIAVLDVKGRLLRTFTSEETEECEPVEPSDAMDGLGDGPPRQPRLAKTPGLHRFVWDLRYRGPWRADSGCAKLRGPLVPPGIYRARLTVGEWSAAHEFEVRLAPRVQAEGTATVEDVTAQAELALRVRDVISEARRAVARLDAVRGGMEENGGPIAPAFHDIHATLVTPSIRYSRPALVDQLEYLYRNLDRADQRPGRDAYERIDELSRSLHEALGQLDALEGD
jgi:photosystem II stability/assembly factor-like uncharacterized protein